MQYSDTQAILQSPTWFCIPENGTYSTNTNVVISNLHCKITCMYIQETMYVSVLQLHRPADSMCSIDRYYMGWNRILPFGKGFSAFSLLHLEVTPLLAKNQRTETSLEKKKSDEEMIYISENQQSLFSIYRGDSVSPGILNCREKERQRGLVN